MATELLWAVGCWTCSQSLDKTQIRRESLRGTGGWFPEGGLSDRQAFSKCNRTRKIPEGFCAFSRTDGSESVCSSVPSLVAQQQSQVVPFIVPQGERGHSKLGDQRSNLVQCAPVVCPEQHEAVPCRVLLYMKTTQQDHAHPSSELSRMVATCCRP